MNSQTTGLLFAGGAALLWSAVTLFLKYCVQFLDPSSIAFMRMAVASIAVIVAFLIFKPKSLLIFKRPPLLGVFGGFLLGIQYITFIKGLELTSAINTEIMIQFGPLFLVFIGTLFFKETLSLIQWFGFVLILSGFALFYTDQAPHFLDKGNVYVTGNLWILLSAVGWAVFSIIQKKLSDEWTPQQLNALSYVFAALTLVFFADFSTITQMLTLPELSVLIFLGFYTAVSYGCYVEAIKRAPITYVSFIIVLNPLLTIAFVKMLEHFDIHIIDFEEIHSLGYIGALLVVSGLITTLCFKAKPSLKSKSL